MPYIVSIYFEEVAMALEAANVLYSTHTLHISELTITDQDGDPFAPTDVAPVKPARKSIPVHDFNESIYDPLVGQSQPAHISKRALADNEKVWLGVGCPECGSLAGRPCVNTQGGDLTISHYTRRMALDYINGQARCIHCGESIFTDRIGGETIWFHMRDQYTWCDARQQTVTAEPIDPGTIPGWPDRIRDSITLDEM
jgi:hypothetical protein